MSSLPNVAFAQIDDAKIRDYLLNPDNAQNGGKAIRFTEYGFDRANWLALAIALKTHPIANPVAETIASPHGTKFIVTCNLSSPDRRNPCRTSIWIVETGQDVPRLVTAY